MKPIVCLGIVTVDALCRVIDRYPTPGGVSFFDQLKVTTGGCAMNVGVTLAKLGLPVELITRVGSDSFGDVVLAECARLGIGASHVVRDPGTHTPFTVVLVHSDGQRSFFHTPGTNATLCADDVDLNRLREAKFLYVGGAMLMKRLDGQSLADVLATARAAGVTTLLDTVYVDASHDWSRVLDPVLPRLDWFIPSLPEAQAYAGQADPVEAIVALRARGCANAAIKLGSDGALLLLRDEPDLRHIPAYRVDRVIDTTGAGDTWSAGFIAGLARGLAPAQAAIIGHAVAAHSIQRLGATDGVPTWDAIERFTAQNATLGQ